jgi:hypothetical protein
MPTWSESFILKLPALSSHQERPRRQRPRPVPTRACALAPVDGRPGASDFAKKPSRLVGIVLSSWRCRPNPHLSLPLPLDSAWPPAPLPLRAPLARRRRLPVRAPATSPVPASAPSLPRMFLLHPRLRLPFGRISQILVPAQRLPPPLHALLPRRRSRPIRAFPSRRRCPPPLPLTPMLVASEPCRSPAAGNTVQLARGPICSGRTQAWMVGARGRLHR